MKKRKTKSKKKVSTNKYKFIVALLSAISLIGLGYVIYDLFLKDLLKKEIISYQNLELPNFEFKKPDQSKNELPENDEITAFEEITGENSKDKEISRESEGKATITNTLSVKINITNVKVEPKIVVQKFKVFLYKEIGNNLSFYYETVELTNVSDPVLAVFSRLKTIKSEGGKLTFVNPRVKLIDYKITPEKTLIVNLSKDINYNPYGGEGILYSLYQLAYTLGSAAGSKEVLVLVEGEEPEYLGGEGIIFDNPINISKFPKINF